MKSLVLNFLVLLVIASAGCTPYESSEVSPAAGERVVPPGNQGQAGVITAGEWNDLDNWAFWEDIISKPEFSAKPAYWKFFNNNRVSVQVVGTDSLPVIDVPVQLKRSGKTIFSARTDNKGKAELWVDLFQYNQHINYGGLTIEVNNSAVFKNASSGSVTVLPYKSGINKIVLEPVAVTDKIEISFVVDATGSMGDELEFLKTELLDVLARVKNNNPTSAIATSSVFYRDEGDDYVTRVSPFTTNISTTLNFIKAQSAAGGGDFPEAVHTALDKAVNELQWSAMAKTRLIFLVLDAPPHHKEDVIRSLQASVAKAAEKGIKIIPVSASGIDKETEFLMRFMATSTNGTYVFITDHSGIGDKHLEATVGQYQVEYLNNLMVRLINKYAQ